MFGKRIDQKNLLKISFFCSEFPDIPGKSWIRRKWRKPSKHIKVQKQLSKAVLRKRCSANLQQIYRRTPMAKCNVNKVAFHGCTPVNLLQIFRTPFLKNSFGWLLFKVIIPFTYFIFLC